MKPHGRWRRAGVAFAALCTAALTFALAVILFAAAAPEVGAVHLRLGDASWPISDATHGEISSFFKIWLLLALACVIGALALVVALIMVGATIVGLLILFTFVGTWISLAGALPVVAFAVFVSLVYRLFRLVEAPSGPSPAAPPSVAER
jgi:hypothetical protein